MFSTILGIHIVGSIILAVLLVYALVSAYRGSYADLPVIARSLALSLGFQLVSGSLMGILTPSLSLFAFCKNIALYSTIVISVLAVVYVRLGARTLAPAFPMRFVIASISLGLLSTLPVLV